MMVPWLYAVTSCSLLVACLLLKPMMMTMIIFKRWLLLNIQIFVMRFFGCNFIKWLFRICVLDGYGNRIHFVSSTMFCGEIVHVACYYYFFLLLCCTMCKLFEIKCNEILNKIVVNIFEETLNWTQCIWNVQSTSFALVFSLLGFRFLNFRKLDFESFRLFMCRKYYFVQLFPKTRTT